MSVALKHQKGKQSKSWCVGKFREVSQEGPVNHRNLNPNMEAVQDVWGWVFLAEGETSAKALAGVCLKC